MRQPNATPVLIPISFAFGSRSGDSIFCSILLFIPSLHWSRGRVTKRRCEPVLLMHCGSYRRGKMNWRLEANEQLSKEKRQKKSEWARQTAHVGLVEAPRARS
jgi:hypothetical protein